MGSKSDQKPQIQAVNLDQNMGSKSDQKPQIQAVNLVVSNKALKLAEAWVSDMRGPTETVAKDTDFEGRPPRLGLGAKPKKRALLADSSNPVERMLLKKIGIGRGRLSSKNQELQDVSNLNEVNSDSDDEFESRANAFEKKRVPTKTSLPHQKRQR